MALFSSAADTFVFSFPIRRFLFRESRSTTEMLPAQEAWRISGEGLFTGVHGETVWKFGIDPESGLRSGQEGSKKSRSAASWRQRRVLETPSAIFQTVAEGEFSEVGRKVFRIRGTRPLDLPITTLDAIVAHGDWVPYPFFLRPAK